MLVEVALLPQPGLAAAAFGRGESDPPAGRLGLPAGEPNSPAGEPGPVRVGLGDSMRAPSPPPSSPTSLKRQHLLGPSLPALFCQDVVLARCCKT